MRPGLHSCIAILYGLDDPGLETRWGATISAPVQTIPEAHPAFRKMGKVSLSRKLNGREVAFTTHPIQHREFRQGRSIPHL